MRWLNHAGPIHVYALYLSSSCELFCDPTFDVALAQSHAELGKMTSNYILESEPETKGHNHNITDISQSQGTIGCTPNSVPMVFIVFSTDCWGL